MNMMKNLYRYIIASLLFSNLYPAVVSIDDITKVANNFIIERSPSNTNFSIAGIQLEKSKNTHYYYTNPQLYYR